MHISMLLYFVQKDFETSLYKLNSVLCDFADLFIFLSIIFDNPPINSTHVRNFLCLQNQTMPKKQF